MNRRGFLKGLAAAVASVAVLRQLPSREKQIPLELTPAQGSARIKDITFLKSRKVFTGHLVMSEDARRTMIERQLRYQTGMAMRHGCNSFERDMRAAGLL